MSQMLRTEEAAELLGIAPATLRCWKSRGLGPAVHKMPGLRGAVRYDRRDIEDFKLQCRQSPSVRAFVREEMSGHL